MFLDKRSTLFTMAVVSTVFLSLVVLAIFYAVPIFGVTFENFDIKVPVKTQLLISNYKYLGIFPFVPLAMVVKIYRNKNITKPFFRRAGWLSIVVFVFTWALLIFTVSALYEPLSNSGEASGITLDS